MTNRQDGTDADLADERVLETSLPARWRPLVDAVTELGALAETDGGLAARRLLAGPIHRRILELAAPHLEATPPVLRWKAETHRRWFTESVLLWTRFADSCGRVRIDTLGSPTLGRFPIDFDPAAGQRVRDCAHIRGAVAAAFEWGEEELTRLEALLEHRISNLAVKRALAGAVTCAIHADGGGDAGTGAVRLFRRLFGDVPLAPGDVDVVVTDTTVFFCLPFADSAPRGFCPIASQQDCRYTLDRPGYSGRPAADRAAIAALLQRLAAAAMSVKNVRFPAFGLYDEAAVDPGLYEELAQAVAADPALARVNCAVVAQTFPTMVLVIPSSEADKYLVHDAWGHGWQESLCEFEWLFHELDELSAPVADDITRAEGEELAVRLERDLRRRIAVGLNLVVAECLADLVEHKFVRQCAPLPSSSLVPAAVLKLDLSWLDAKRMARLWSAPYRQLPPIANAVAEERFVAALSLTPAPPPGHADEAVVVNLVQRAALGVATLEAALSELLDRGEARYAEMVAASLAAGRPAPPRWQCPAACIDLIALAVGWFYDQDPAVHIWHLDELVAREIWPALVELENQLAR